MCIVYFEDAVAIGGGGGLIRLYHMQIYVVIGRQLFDDAWFVDIPMDGKELVHYSICPQGTHGALNDHSTFEFLSQNSCAYLNTTCYTLQSW